MASKPPSPLDFSDLFELFCKTDCTNITFPVDFPVTRVVGNKKERWSSGRLVEFLGTFGGLGAAGLSASLLTSILPTTLEDLLALALCSAGGLLALYKFPARKQQAVDKVKRAADGLARQIEEAMRKDLLETTLYLEELVRVISKPYQEAAQHKLDKLSATADELAKIETKLKTLQSEIQNLN